MLLDELEALKRPVPMNADTALMVNAYNDGVEAAIKVIRDAFQPMSGSLPIVGVEHPDHPVAQALHAYGKE